MRRSSFLPLFVPALALAFAACGGEVGTGASSSSSSSTTSSSSSGTGGGPVLHGNCASTEQIGTFVVQHEIDYSAVNGEVLDGVLPSKILQNVGEEGDCILWRRTNPFCDPPCNAGQTCGQDAKCIPFPAPKSVGAVTITGLTKPVSMKALEYYDTMMPHPAFNPGSLIELVAEGAADPGFTLHGQGFAPIVIPKETWTIKKGEPLTIHWTPDNSSPLARVKLRLNIDQHGNSPVELVCEVDDTGEKTVPSSLLDQLIGFGVTGFPAGHVSRHTVDSTQVGTGCVSFEVFSHVLGDLQVADHTPCDPTHPCPMGKMCDLKTGTCL
ncbi:MAG: hypothetical protein U0359_34430 [Byssovorax sp.]